MAAAVGLFLMVPLQGAAADVADTWALTDRTVNVCQPGDICVNEASAEKKDGQGTMSARLGVQSARNSGGDISENSEQSFAARFADSFIVPRGTQRVTFTGTWNITAVATVAGAASGGCELRESGPAYTTGGIFLYIGGLYGADVDSSQHTFTNVFTPTDPNFRRRLTLFTELRCFVDGQHVSRIELDVDAVLEHLHVSFER